jgi:hypothetical protein
LCLIAFLLSAANCADAISLSSKFQGLVTAQPATFSSLINNLKSYAFAETLNIQRNGIAANVDTVKKFNLVSGTPVARMLRSRGRGGRGGRRCFRRAFIRPHVHVRRAFVRPHVHVGRAFVRPHVHVAFGRKRGLVAAVPIPVVRCGGRFSHVFAHHRGRLFFVHFAHKHQPAPPSLQKVYAAYTSRTIEFTPFKDLTNLKFGSKYQNIRIDQNINGEGLSVYQTSGSFGTRTGSDITYKTGFGWSFGLSTQQYSSTTVQRSKKRWFRTKRWTEVIKVPRGFLPAELEVVRTGLENEIYGAIAAKLTANGSRRLSEALATQMPEIDFTQIGDADTFQKMDGVAKEDLKNAIKSMTEGAKISKKQIEAGAFSVWKKGINHRVEVEMKGGQYGIIVKSRKN